MDRYSREEMLGFKDDFTDLPEQGETERGAALPAPEDEERNPTVFGRHDFKASNNPRNRQACAKCGRTAGNPIHRQHPELRKAAIVSALDMACKATREDDDDMALIQVAVATRLLRGET